MAQHLGGDRTLKAARVLHKGMPAVYNWLNGPDGLFLSGLNKESQDRSYLYEEVFGGGVGAVIERCDPDVIPTNQSPDNPAQSNPI